MTAQQQQQSVAAEARPVAAPGAAARPVATVAAATRTVAARPRPSTPQPKTERRPQTRNDSPAPETVHTGLPAEPPRERPRQRESLDLPVLRIVCWQLALVLAFLAIGRPWPVVTALLLASATLLSWTALRYRGRWLSEELTERARLLLRRRQRDLPDAEAGHLLLRALAPGSAARTVELAGTSSGVVSRTEELVAVLRPVDTGPAVLAQLALSGALLADTGEPSPALPAIRLQLVLHRGPQQTDHTRAWLAVRALREPNFADDAELLVALNNTVRRLHRKLRRAGLGATALTEPELLSTLVALTHTGPGRGTIREERRHWRAGPITQVGIRLTGLGARPVQARIQALHRLLAAVPGTACTIAITAPEHAAVLRIAATTDAAADAAAERLLRMHLPGLRLERMDNQHAPAVAASLPIGGNP
ncbi:type VII secretion protein EccE [Prauserella endophytica]|uniref:type VII secretion protein EccE n=1 Tax=Prauserella endophytica TaxID=1592324 RepID=UPI00197E0E8A|nr:type VII secretion protein EccE [Prauserella endophytica]